MTPLKKITDRIFFRTQHVCPRWFCFSFDNVFRRLFHDPDTILKPCLGEGLTVLDIGPGRGYFTIPIARAVGTAGKVIAADVQQQMLKAVQYQARKAGLENRIILHLCTTGRIGIDTAVDFCLAFWMVHEVPDKMGFFNEISSILKKSGRMLVAEPKLHVTRTAFEEILSIAKSAGLIIAEQPEIRFSHSAVLIKPES